MTTSTWPLTRQRPLTPLERATFLWEQASDPADRPRRRPVESEGVLELRRQLRPTPRPPVQATGTQQWVEPLGEFPLVSVSTDDRMYVDSFVRAATHELGVPGRAPYVEFFKAPTWAHRGLYSPKYPRLVFVRVGQTMAHTLATALHETAHYAGIGDETEAEAFAQGRLRDSIYGAEARLAEGSTDRLVERWNRCLRGRGIEA